MQLATTPATEKLLAKDSRIPECDRLHVSMHEEDYFLFTAIGPTGKPVDASYFSRADWLHRIPGARLGYGGCGTPVPKTDTSVIIAVAVWDVERIVFDSVETKISFMHLLLTYVNRDRSRMMQAEYWVNHIIPDDAPKGNETNPLMPYQRVAAACGSAIKNFAFFMEQGTGKTCTTIVTCEELVKKGAFPYVIIVAPKNVRRNWLNEIEMFSTMKYSARIAAGGKFERFTALLEGYLDAKNGKSEISYLVVSYDSLESVVTALERLEVGIAVGDEIHYAKSVRTKRWYQMGRLRDAAEHRLALTGTPIANTVMDLYAQLEFLEERASGFASFDQFRNFYGVYDEVPTEGGSCKKLVDVQNIPLLQERLARMSFICTKEQALPDLPEKVWTIREVEMTSDQLKLYEQIAEELAAEIEGLGDDVNSLVTANNVLTRMLRLAQITSGHIPTDGEILEGTDKIVNRQIVRFETNPKLDELERVLAEELTPNSKAVIWAHFKEDVRAIHERLSKTYECVVFGGGDKQREDAMNRFNNGTARVFIGNPASGGTGTNLLGKSDEDTAADLCIRYSANWSSLQRSQSEDRTHRKGMRRQCRYVDLLVPGSIDTTIYDRVRKKIDTAKQIQNVSQVLAEALQCLKS